MTLMAEHVLQSVLDARPVDVADIRAALEGLREHLESHKSLKAHAGLDAAAVTALIGDALQLKARVLQLEIVAALAAEVVRVNDREVVDYGDLWDAVDAMKAALAELGNEEVTR